ncbi:hypothetical protein HMPREF9378_0598 [Streptococcus sanguinis SK1 = NCTC 7863]|uniref:Uncharacterized protein n=2 Tax=Streptococcus sanguinis TaxID=1305 RepID=F0IV03_STRSA|nr:hypothetical protein HMPREF9381_1007 [Streptococcus sanguinis SK72]EGD38408.1 hypothetical protein HMPREF9384_1665 [Streptococcus sanguinis SK160]EGF08521.1 hypothetical protein HMPREF9378_0598 [Streptococcus sanguinis SK1 = NCTC 7863]
MTAANPIIYKPAQKEISKPDHTLILYNFFQYFSKEALFFICSSKTIRF